MVGKSINVVSSPHLIYRNIVHLLIFFFILMFSAGSLSALSGVFAGLGVEGNANTRKGAALGGGISGGVDLDRQFSLGLKTAFSSNMDTVTTLETSAFFRYYLPLKIDGLFAQADIGAAFFFEDGKSYPAFLAGLSAGWRLYLDKNWYIEPLIRGGYPFFWGAGLFAGFRFNM